VRIIGGAARGRRLLAPRGRRTRPTSDYVREALFDVLSEQIPGRAFLDLYAGTGAVGIEALSRGASTAVFVERNPTAVAALRRNLGRAGFLERAQVFAVEVLRFLRQAASRPHRFDLIFLDPPYGARDTARALGLIARHGLLATGGTLIVERSTHSAATAASGGIARVRELRHGDSTLELYRWEAA
jgi:16S rRNA (guanine966-N2)-methyltransferase